jgi:PAS domain S-box-containing protein
MKFMSPEMEQFTTLSQTTDVFKQSETLFRTLIENSLDAIVLIDAEGNVTYASLSIERILGYTPEEFIAFHTSEVIHPGDRQPATDLFMKLLSEQRSSVTIQYRVRHKNGSWRWVEGTWKNLLADPHILSVVINIHDVTERKQAEERQHLLNEASNILVSSLDHQITLKEVAELIVPSLADYCRIALLDANQQIKDISVNHIDPEKITLVRALYEQYKDRASTTHGLQKLLETGRSELISNVSNEVLETIRDNPEMLAIVNALGLQSYMGVPLIARGKTIGAITFSSVQPFRNYTQDDMLFAEELARRIALVLDNARLYREAQEEITERKQAEAQLRESEERYRLVVERTTDLITLLDGAGTIIYISPSCETILGYQPDEMIGQYAFTLHHPDDLPLTLHEFARLFEGSNANIPSFRVRHKDGHWVIMAGTGSAIYDEQGNPTLIVSTSHDITQQAELERRKDEFISIASHELKTPVTSLKGFTNLFQRHLTKQADEKTLHYLNRMDSQLNKLTKLIADLLDVSKMQTGQLTYQEETFDLDALVKETVENLQAATPTHQLFIETAGAVQVTGDRDRIGQVLINLLTNAIKYSPQADKVIVHLASDQQKAIVSVQDFGIGIAESHHDKIFERFYQVADPEERTFPGLGIGLHLSCEIVKRHGGNMWVESSKGNGATFYFTIPLRRENTFTQSS